MLSSIINHSVAPIHKLKMCPYEPKETNFQLIEQKAMRISVYSLMTIHYIKKPIDNLVECRTVESYAILFHWIRCAAFSSDISPKRLQFDSHQGRGFTKEKCPNNYSVLCLCVCVYEFD